MGMRRFALASLAASALLLPAGYIRAQIATHNTTIDTITVTPLDNVLRIKAEAADALCAVIQPLDKSNQVAQNIKAYCNPTDKAFLKAIEASKISYARTLNADAITYKNGIASITIKYDELKRRTNLALIDELQKTRASSDPNVKIEAALKLANSDRELDKPRDQEISAATNAYKEADSDAAKAWQAQDKALKTSLFNKLFPQGIGLIRLPDSRQPDTTANFVMSSTAQFDGLCAILASVSPAVAFADAADLCKKTDPSFNRDMGLIAANYQQTLTRDAESAATAQTNAQQQFDIQQAANKRALKAALNDANADYGIAILQRDEADKAAMSLIMDANAKSEERRRAADISAGELRDTQNITAWANLIGRTYPNGIAMTLQILFK